MPPPDVPSRASSNPPAMLASNSDRASLRFMSARSGTEARGASLESVPPSLGTADLADGHEGLRPRSLFVATIAKDSAKFSRDTLAAIPTRYGRHGFRFSIRGVAVAPAKRLYSLVAKLVGKGQSALQALARSGQVAINSNSHVNFLSTQEKRQLKRGTGVESRWSSTDQADIALKSYSTIPCILGAI